jgi:predicted CopG family antitoxin
MKDKEYPVRTIRISDEVWEELKEKRQQSKLSWNLFIKQLMEGKGK